MPFRAYYLSPDGNLRRGLGEEEVRAAFASNHGLLWVDLVNTTKEDGEFLERVFHFHPLAIEDCVSPRIHPPKIDDYGPYLFIIVHGINYTVESDIVETTELALFLSPSFVVSNHNSPLYSVEFVRRLVEGNGRPMRRGADFLAHTLIDAVVDNILPTIDQLSAVAEDLELEVIRTPQPSTLEAILKLKRSTLRLHRVMAPQRELMNRLSRGEFPLIREETRIFYRDIYDHVVRIEDLNQTIRDMADHLLATYLSAVANRQNEMMKVLAVVATIFLPLSLIAGIYGMNFEYMPELKWRWGYFAVLGLIGTIVAATIGLFWARRWITWGRQQVARVRSFIVPRERLLGDLGNWQKRG